MSGFFAFIRISSFDRKDEICYCRTLIGQAFFMSIFSLIQVNKGNLAFAGFAGAVAVFVGLVFFSRGYSVQTDFLVMQHSAEKQDFYTLSKSVEYSGNILKEAVLSDLFFTESAKTGYFNAGVFSSNERDRLKEWRKSISISQRSGAGILEVTVKRSNQTEAMGIARAISETLINKNSMFRSGEEDSIFIKTISGPIVEQTPTVSDLIVGAIAGMIAGMSMMLLRVAQKRARGMRYNGEGNPYFEKVKNVNAYREEFQNEVSATQGNAM